MDGYSVKDAAIVLGIPERRVWELLARGVLAGAPEGPDGMIVYLQPKSAPSSVARSEGAAGAGEATPGAKGNGNGGSHELSPFRELLTEFRNLTERYGQALLALGEARGEVAALRGRVELLEARMDLRLPSAPTATVAWEIPEFAPEVGPPADAREADAAAAGQEPAAEVDDAVAGEDEPAAEPMIDLIEEAVIAEAAHELTADEMPAVDDAAAEIAAEAAETEPEQPRRRSRRGRKATAAFAAALARAQDPTIAELPGAEETAAALAALQRDIEASRAAEAPPEEVAGPIEPEPAADEQPDPEAVPEAQPAAPEAIAAAAEPEPIHEAPADAELEPAMVEEEPAQAAVPSYYSTDVMDPDWFADGDFSWLEAAQAEALRTEAAEAGAGAVPGAVPAEPTTATDQSDEGEGQVETGEVTNDAGEGATNVASELAFGDHPATEAEEPDLGHAGGFEPTIESQAMAEEEARAAVQDAFDDGAAAEEEAPAADADLRGGVVTAAAEREPAEDVTAETEAVVAEPEATGQPDAPLQPEAEPEAVMAQPEPSVGERPAAEQERVYQEVASDAELPEAGGDQSAESERIQDAFEPPTDRADASVHAEHAAEVETEAIQDAFEEPMPASDRSSGAASAPPLMDTPAVHGPEEFIAQSQPPAGPPAAPQAPSVSGEEELMWLGDEFEAADLEVAAEGWRSSDATPAAAKASPVLELSDAELAQLAEDEGWDVDEVEAIRRLLGRPSDASSAMIAPEAPREATGSSLPSAGSDDPEDPEWLEGRGGPAADAYRRLRKLFPS